MRSENIPDLSDDIVMNKIFIIRGQKVMLDRDLAELYGVETKVLKQSVRRNIERFPEDFMFELTKIEHNNLRSQVVTLKQGQHSKYLPFAFTEQGVAMLSSTLNSKKAIQINIQIIRVFTKIRAAVTDTLNLKLDIESLKKKFENQDKNIELLFTYLDELMDKQEFPKPRTQIGYKTHKE